MIVEKCSSSPYRTKLVYLTSSKENYIQRTEHIQRESYAERCISIRLMYLGNMRDNVCSRVHTLDLQYVKLF